jgi:hypothetical protein
MFLPLFLSHLLADFLLQPDWMAKQKDNRGVLAIHAAVHLVLMLVLVGPIRWLMFPYLAGLATFHFSLDLAKLALQKVRPGWVILPFLVDQLLHLLSIGFVVWLASRIFSPGIMQEAPAWIVYLTGYLLVTHVWFISERILAYRDPDYREEVIAQSFSRMITRALLLSLFLWGSQQLENTLLMAGLVYRLPYLTSKNALRAVLTDLFVAFAGMTFIRLIS